VVVAHSRTVPLSVDDGEIVQHIPPTQDGATLPLLPKVDLGKLRARVFLDPHVEPGTLSPIRIRHPETDAARV
jgi:hypothetical protein